MAGPSGTHRVTGKQQLISSAVLRPNTSTAVTTDPGTAASSANAWTSNKGYGPTDKGPIPLMDIRMDFRHALNDNHSRSSQARTGHQPQGSNNRRPRQDSNNKSTNPDFEKLVKALYRWVQLRHHLSNWWLLPSNIKQKIDEVTENITPPNPTPSLKRNRFLWRVTLAITSEVG